MEKDEIRELDLRAARELAQTLGPLGNPALAAEYQALLDWLEADESRVIPRTREELLAAREAGCPNVEKVLKFLDEEYHVG